MLSLLVLFAAIQRSQQATDNTNPLCKANQNTDSNKYDLTPLGQKVYKVTDNEDWSYHFAMCGELNDVDLGNGTQKDSILQVGKGELHVVATHIISRHGGDMWVNVAFGGGDNYNNHCEKQPRKAQILFICDPRLTDYGQPVLLDEANSDATYCYYMFEWSTPLVCPERVLKGHRGMSPAKLLLLEFVVIVVVYLVLGIGYKRFVLGARGVEQIPNLQFWKDMKEACSNTLKKCKGEDATTTGVRSDNGGNMLNIAVDDDDRLIM